MEISDQINDGPPWRILDLLAVIIIVNIIVILLFKGLENEILSLIKLNNSYHPQLVYILLGTLTQALSLAGLVLFFALKRGGSLRDLGLVKDNLGSNLLLGLTGGFLLLGAIIVVSALIAAIAYYLGVPQKPQTFVEILQGVRSWQGILVAVAIGSILAPISEELYFRGFTYPVLRSRWGKIPAMVATSCFFAALHFDIFRFIPLVLGGLGLNYLYERTGSLYTSMFAHSVWNTTMTALIFALPQSM